MTHHTSHRVRFLTLIFLGAKALSAAVLTVNNNPGAVAMFTDLPAAYAAAQEGDTILLAGSATVYNSPSNGIRKSITLIGPGYYLTENSIAGISKKSARITSVMVGHDFAIANPSGITIRGIELGPYTTMTIAGVTTPGAAGPVYIEKCKISELRLWVPASVRGCAINVLSSSDHAGGAHVTNSILGDVSINSATAVDHCVITGNPTGTSTVSAVSNSILTRSSSPPTISFAGSFSHCLSIGNPLPAGAGNINGATGVFVGGGTEDSMWQLAASSPARGTGVGSADMGIFGGPTPYVLSGLPGLPRITRLSVPATATSGSGLLFEVEAQAFSE